MTNQAMVLLSKSPGKATQYSRHECALAQVSIGPDVAFDVARTQYSNKEIQNLCNPAWPRPSPHPSCGCPSHTRCMFRTHALPAHQTSPTSTLPGGKLELTSSPAWWRNACVIVLGRDLYNKNIPDFQSNTSGFNKILLHSIQFQCYQYNSRVFRTGVI